MESISFDEVLGAVEGKILLKGKVVNYSSVSTDSRKIEKESIFIALKGDNFNGNDYAMQAINKGAALCIIDEVKFDATKVNEEGSIILVRDSKKALLDLAKYYRSRLKIKIIGVTGSTGKTSTKDLIAAALSDSLNVFKTKGNFNNEIGLPLMIFNIDSSFDAAVLEMGMSNFDEIHRMADAARPDIAVITNIGISHIENLKTQENILKAKMEITDFFNKDSVLIVNGDDELLSGVKSDKYKIIKVGTMPECDFTAQDIEMGEQNIRFVSNYKEMKSEYSLNIPGRHNVLNAMLAIACATTLEIQQPSISKGFEKLEVTSMRLDIIKKKKFTIINDCYNASPDSMKAALDVLRDIKCKKKIAVLGTMRELGDKSYEAHKAIGKYASEVGVDLLVTLGDFSFAYSEGIKDSSTGLSLHRAFTNMDEAVEYLIKQINEGDAVLIKASRAMKFENIVNKLIKYAD